MLTHGYIQSGLEKDSYRVVDHGAYVLITTNL